MIRANPTALALVDDADMRLVWHTTLPPLRPPHLHVRFHLNSVCAALLHLGMTMPRGAHTPRMSISEAGSRAGNERRKARRSVIPIIICYAVDTAPAPFPPLRHGSTLRALRDL